MKKAIALVLFAATVFTLAACAKKGERYKEPPTEVVTFDNGERIVYEIVTDAKGEPATDEEGQTVFRLYDPPVTQKGGYLVTDAEGSTIKRSASNNETATVNSDFGIGVLDDETVPVTNANGQTVPPQTNADGQTVPPQTNADGQTVAAQTNAGSTGNGGSTGIGGETGATIPVESGTTAGSGNDKDKKDKEPTTIPQLEHASTVPYQGKLTQGKANKLLKILDGIENPFEEDIVENRYVEGKESLRVYVNNILAAEREIQADPEIYAFVTKANLDYWNYYLTQMQIKYDEFAAIVGAQKPGEKPRSSVYTSYVAFQDEYRKEIEIFFSIQEAAEQYAR